MKPEPRLDEQTLMDMPAEKFESFMLAYEWNSQQDGAPPGFDENYTMVRRVVERRRKLLDLDGEET